MSVNPVPGLAAQQDELARWTAWEREYSESSRRAAFHARIAFAIFLTGAAVWFGLKLASIPV